MFRVAAALVILTSLALAQGRQAAGIPFTAGITDAASLKRAVDARMSRARTLLDSMLAVTGARTVDNTLEPYDEIEVTVPDDLVGTVMSDLASRRGRVLGQDAADGMAVVRAHVPATELVRYAIDLRSATHGTGTFTRTFASYEPAVER